jgi:hypothetical protein
MLSGLFAQDLQLLHRPNIKNIRIAIPIVVIFDFCDGVRFNTSSSFDSLLYIVKLFLIVNIVTMVGLKPTFNPMAQRL